jgi:hypothetical protein
LSDNITLWPVAKYFVSAALVFLGLYVQLTITETPVFGKALNAELISNSGGVC